MTFSAGEPAHWAHRGGAPVTKEPAHREAFVSLGPGGQTSAAQWQLVSQSLHAWGEERGVRPADLGARVTYLATPPRTADSVPDCDFAVPLSGQAP